MSDPNRPGYFIDASKTNLPDVENATQGIALADLDGDGDLDMVLANEVPPNRLLLNDGRGRFTDASDRMALSVPLHTREVHVFDATGDGKPDILFLNLTSNARQYERDPQARFSSTSPPSGRPPIRSLPGAAQWSTSTMTVIPT